MTLTKGTKIGIAVGIVAVVAVIVVLIAAMPRGDGGGNGGGDETPLLANLSIVTWSASKDTWGDARFAVTMTNTGEITGTKILWCSITIGENVYRTHQTVTIAPHDTRDYEPYIDLPIGTIFSSATSWCWLENDNVVYQT